MDETTKFISHVSWAVAFCVRKTHSLLLCINSGADSFKIAKMGYIPSITWICQMQLYSSCTWVRMSVMAVVLSCKSS
jgi:hypothetical protein